MGIKTKVNITIKLGFKKFEVIYVKSVFVSNSESTNPVWMLLGNKACKVMNSGSLTQPDYSRFNSESSVN